MNCEYARLKVDGSQGGQRDTRDEMKSNPSRRPAQDPSATSAHADGLSKKFTKRETVSGEVLNVTSTALEYFDGSQKAVRKGVERRLIPFRRRGGRIIFLRSELEQFFAALPGCRVEEALKNAMGRAANKHHP